MIPRATAPVFALSVAISIQAFAAGPLAPEAAIGAFEIPLGCQVELVAAEPTVESPCAMAFDELGQLYVAENRGYPRGPMEGDAAMGRIALLRDKDGDGRMDERVTFADGFTFPNGVLPWKDGLIVTCAPDVLFLRDTDGDGRADERKVLLTGFDTAKSTQLRVNAPLVGPDGWIWLASGLSGGKISNPERPEYGVLDLKTDLRFHPDTGKFEAVDGRSQFGHSFNDFGQRFICMNRIQVQHVVLPSAALKRNPHLAFSETVQNCPELIPNALLRGGGGAARIFPISSNLTTADSHSGTFSAACSVMIWPGTALGRWQHGTAFSCEPTGNLVHADKLNPVGGTFAAVAELGKIQGSSLARPEAGRHEFLASKDDWFRPVFLTTGPDGALYICDMYRKIIEHPDYLPEDVRKHTDFQAGKHMGRIWRVKAQAPPSPVVLPDRNAAIDSLVGQLDSPNGWVRQTAMRLLTQRSHELTRDSLDRGNGSLRTIPGRAAMLMLADQGDLLNSSMMADAMFNGDARLRALVMRLAPERMPVHLLTDPDTRVRFEAALVVGAAVSEIGALPGAVPTLAEIALKDGSDRWTRAAVLSSAAKLEERLVQELIRDGRRSDLTLIRELGRIIGRKLQSPSRAKEIEALLDACERSRLETAVAFAAGCADSPQGLPESGTISHLLREAAQMAAKAETKDARLLAIDLIGSSVFKVAGDSLVAALDSPDPDVQLAAIRALARMNDPAGSIALLSAERWKLFPPSLRDTALGALASRPQGVRALLKAVETKELPTSTIDALRRGQWMKHSDPEIRERAKQLFAVADVNQQKALADAKQALGLPAQASNGRQVFSRICASCHRFDREGHAVGPDLFDIRNQTKESILHHIVIPEHEIAPGFAAYTVETSDGRTLAGVISSETGESVTVRQPGGLEETVPRTGIKSLVALPTSLMPPGLDRAMTAQELADLLSYLRGEK